MKWIAAILTAAFLVVPAAALAGPSVVGSMQAWDPADPNYDLTLNGNGVWVLTKSLLAGGYDYKVTETDAWDGNDFPGANQVFTLAGDDDVTWFVNLGATVGVKEGDEFVFHSPNPPIMAGDFQSELGGADWDQTDMVNTVMTDGDNDDVWELTAVIAPAGPYQGKVVLNNNWDQNTGDNVTFSSDGLSPITFTYDMATNTTDVSTQVVTLQDVTVTFHLCLSDTTVTSGEVCVTGNQPPITVWGYGVPMDLDCPSVSPKLYSVDVLFPAGSDPFVEYKYKKDDCATWEATANRNFLIDDSGATMDLALEGWENIEPDCPDCTSPVEDATWGTIKSLYR